MANRFNAFFYQLGTTTGYPIEWQALNIDADPALELVIGSIHYPIQNSSIGLYAINFDSTGRPQLLNNWMVGAESSAIHPRELITADFNGDGKLDMFVADQGFDGTPFPGAQNRLILSSSSGYRDATSNLPATIDFSHSATASDIDNDGDVDIFVGNLWNPTFTGPYILINNGVGNFTEDANRLPIDISSIQSSFTTSLFIDVDKDGDQDLFLGSNGTFSGRHRILLNDGDGNFLDKSPSSNPYPIYGVNNTVTVDSHLFDFNNDGLKDVLVSSTRFTPFYEGRGIQALLSDGTGTLRDVTKVFFDMQSRQGSWAPYLHLVDLNGDGLKDVLAEATGAQARPDAWINTGANRFVLAGLDFLPNVSGSLEPLDVNSDGRIDFAISGGKSGNVQSVGVVIQRDPGAKQTGTSAANTLIGDNSNDVLNGLAGNDLLVGAVGADVLTGGDGNDRIYGGGHGDTLSGGNGNDLLSGGSGLDKITGNSGADRFFFQLSAASTSVDTITDFTHNIDEILLSHFSFPRISATGNLSASQFKSCATLGTGTFESNDVIIYDRSNGKLYYDVNGLGSSNGGIYQIALLSNKPTSLNASDFLIVA